MILAIDSATRSISVATAELGQLLAEESWESRNNHTSELAPAVERLVGAGRLTAIAVAIGPGSFTGVRIGLGFAKGLSLARGLPLMGVRTFEIVARAAPAEGAGIVAVVPAGRGRVIWSMCGPQGEGWVAADDGRVGTWDEVARAATPATVVVGEIDAEGERILKAAGVRSLKSARQARHLASIGWERWQAGALDDPAALAPVYALQPKSGT